MLTSVHFSKIRQEIISHLKKANKEIKLAVAWLTDEDLIRELTLRQRAGVTVRVAISNAQENFINISSLSDFISAGGQLFIVVKTFLHHKFCIIDETVIINGSYNWSYPARRHEENITVMEGDKKIREDYLVYENFKAKHNYLCEKVAVHVVNLQQLSSFKTANVDITLIVAKMDEEEIKLRQQFQDSIKKSFEMSRELGIDVSPSLLERMQLDGGGVEFVKRILRDEMTSGEMKSGFKKLEEHIPHQVRLSLEYLVIQPAFRSLFTDEEFNFCKSLMTKYNI